QLYGRGSWNRDVALSPEQQGRNIRDHWQVPEQRVHVAVPGPDHVESVFDRSRMLDYTAITFASLRSQFFAVAVHSFEREILDAIDSTAGLQQPCAKCGIEEPDALTSSTRIW